MALNTQQSLSGFIATEPTLSQTRTGEARFYARIGQEHYERAEDGTFNQLETTYHDFSIYRRSAEIAFERFHRGDNFIAEGYVREYERVIEGQSTKGEEFIAKRIGHDSARQRYAVDRTRRGPAGAAAGAGHEVTAEGATAGSGAATANAEEPAPAKQSRWRGGRSKTTGSGRKLAAIPASGQAAPAAGDDIPF